MVADESEEEVPEERKLPEKKRRAIGMAHKWAAQFASNTRRSEDTRAEVEAALDAVNSAAGRARATWLAFLTVVAYLLVTVGGTSHKQLLLSEAVKLPVVDAHLPIEGFFWVAPFALLLVHINLLVLLTTLGTKTSAFCKSLKQDTKHTEDLLARLDTFVATQLLRRTVYGAFTTTLMLFMVWFTVAGAPVLLFLFFLVQFLPYQDLTILWLHRAYLLADLSLVYFYWPRVRVIWEQVHVSSPTSILLWARFRPVVGLCASGLIFLFGSIVATIPGELSLGWAPPWLGSQIERVTLALFESPIIVTAHRQLWLSRTLVLPDTDLGQELKLNAAQENPEQNVTLKVSEPLRLAKRSLRGAILDRAHLERANLASAHLEGASLREAHLSGADLSQAYLEKAYLVGADLRAATLASAHLARAEFDWSHMEGASLEGADLKGARLLQAHLEGASLVAAMLEGADLQMAYLQGANLSGAHIESALLNYTTVWRTKPPREFEMDEPMPRIGAAGAFFYTHEIPMPQELANKLILRTTRLALEDDQERVRERMGVLLSEPRDAKLWKSAWNRWSDNTRATSAHQRSILWAQIACLSGTAPEVAEAILERSYLRPSLPEGVKSIPLIEGNLFLDQICSPHACAAGAVVDFCPKFSPVHSVP